MKPTIVCPKCKGEGNVQMSEELQLALNAVGKGATVQQVIEKIGWTGHPTAINNRLQDLLVLGFLTRDRKGHAWWYSKTKQSGETFRATTGKK